MRPRTEPHHRLLRPTPMTRLLDRTPARPALVAAVSTVLAAALTACGSVDPGSGASSSSSAQSTPSSSSSAAPVAGSCAGNDPALTRARALSTGDVDGDGRPERVALTAAGGACGNLLLAVGAKDTLAARLPAGEPAVRSAYAVTVPGHRGDLVVTRTEHPRGGYQLRVYAADGTRLTELTRGTEPLVPFVATDVQEQPLSIDCVDGGLVVTQAVAHQPSGVIFAWDIRRTAYTLDGARLVAGPEKELKDNVLPAQLTKEWPDLVEHTAFVSCRAS